MNAKIKSVEADVAASIELFDIPAHVRAIAPYIGGKPIAEVAREFGLNEASIIKLASNENPLGMPASAKAAMLKAFDDLARYPDDNAFDLKRALSEQLGVPTDWITLGSGSSDILILSAIAFAGPDASVVISQYGFVVYPIATQKVGARAIVVPATAGLGHDLPAMSSAVRADTRLIFVANPSNPTGTFASAHEIEDFLDSVPVHVVVVLDEAYTEFLAQDKRMDSIALVRRYPNLVLSRTFSKAYGLAGLRVGFGVAQPHLTDVMNRVRAAFNVNSLAQAAAVAVLKDETFLKQSFETNRAGYLQLTAAFRDLGIEYIPSHANFVLFRAGKDDGAGARVNLALLKRGIIVRPVGNYGLPQWLRVSIGLPQENAAFVEALKSVLATEPRAA
jgi:histidinol-phosphate aminotransferase